MLASPLYKIAKAIALSRDRRYASEVGKPIATIAAASSIAIALAYRYATSLGLQWIYACSSLAVAVLIFTIARCEADGFPELPKALEASGYTIALLASALYAPKLGFAPLALAISSAIARAVSSKLGRESLSLSIPITLLLTTLLLTILR